MAIFQGDTYLCGIFASVIATTKAVERIIKLKEDYQRELTHTLYEHLDNCGELLTVHKEGTTNAQLADYFICINEKLKIDFDISIQVTRPLYRKKITAKTLIERIGHYSRMQDTSVLIGLEGKHEHWTTVKVVKRSINLIDSSYISRVPIKNIPKIHTINKRDVFVIRARKHRC